MEATFSLVALEPPLRGFRLVGELDMSSAHELSKALTTMSGRGDLTLELSELEFIDSSGLHAIVQYARSLNGVGDKLILVDPTAMTERIFEIAGVAQHAAIVVVNTNHG